MKTLSKTKGQYCMYKKGNYPEGCGNGYVQWDDEDDNNKNSVTGQLPDGSYDRNTKIFFCCRDDGYATNVINLPTDTPFVLLKSDIRLFQIVNGTKTREESFLWDNEDDDSGYFIEFRGKHLFLRSSDNNVLLYSWRFSRYSAPIH